MKEKTRGFQMKTKLLLGVALLSVGLSVAPPTIVEVGSTDDSRFRSSSTQ